MYFQKQWINTKKIGKYTPVWNYYATITNLEFDLKYLFVTNNISENINSILNSFFNKKYPVFNEWKKAILDIVDIFEQKKFEITRRNKTSNIIIYYIKNIYINNKKVNLLKNEEIKVLNDLEQVKNNFVSINPISTIFNLSNEDKINNKENKISFESDSDSEENELNDEDDIDNLIENLNNFKLEDNQEYKYYLCQLFKDIDLDSIKNEIINELE